MHVPDISFSTHCIEQKSDPVSQQTVMLNVISPGDVFMLSGTCVRSWLKKVEVYRACPAL